MLAPMTTTDQNTKPIDKLTLDELNKLRDDLVDEKAGNVQRLAEINSDLKQSHIKSDRKLIEELHEERSEIVSDEAQINTEIQSLNTAIKKANRAMDKSSAIVPLVVQLVCADIAAGNTCSTRELTASALNDLSLITEMTHAHFAKK